MKLRGLVLNFYIHVSRSDLFITKIGQFGISFFFYCMRELSTQPQEGREGQGTATKQGLAWQPFPALPSAPSVEPRVHINDIFTYVRNWLHFESVLN